MNKLNKKVLGYTQSAVTLGAGSALLSGMGQGQLASQIITPAANMMGPLITADLGLGVLDAVSKRTQYKKR